LGARSPDNVFGGDSDLVALGEDVAAFVIAGKKKLMEILVKNL
jgi:hypothetical protein